ncbi:hypothetical protein L3Q82_013584, partial [Scortum barcoo]
PPCDPSSGQAHQSIKVNTGANQLSSQKHSSSTSHCAITAQCTYTHTHTQPTLILPAMEVMTPCTSTKKGVRRPWVHGGGASCLGKNARGLEWPGLGNGLAIVPQE